MVNSTSETALEMKALSRLFGNLGEMMRGHIDDSSALLTILDDFHHSVAVNMLFNHCSAARILTF